MEDVADEPSSGLDRPAAVRVSGAAVDQQQPQASERCVEVVWWRELFSARVGPNGCGVGWALADGSAAGQTRLVTHHQWLSAGTIETQLGPVLTAQLGLRVTLRPAAAVEPNPVVRLARAGRHLVDTEMTLEYGIDVVGGVVAELRGRGMWGMVAIERHLIAPVRLSVAEWAEAALASFSAADPGDLLEDGWEQVGLGRWQLLAVQSGS